MLVDVDLGHGQTRGGAIEPLGILLHAKQIEIAIRAQIGLGTVENHLPAVEDLGCRIKRQRPIRPDDRIVPAPSSRVLLREHARGEVPSEPERIRQNSWRRLCCRLDADVELAHEAFSWRKCATSDFHSSSSAASAAFLPARRYQ